MTLVSIPYRSSDSQKNDSRYPSAAAIFVNPWSVTPRRPASIRETLACDVPRRSASSPCVNPRDSLATTTLRGSIGTTARGSFGPIGILAGIDVRVLRDHLRLGACVLTNTRRDRKSLGCRVDPQIDDVLTSGRCRTT